VAVARIRPRGRLALIDLCPGARDLLTPRAVGELRRASVVAGSRSSLDEVADLLRPGTRVLPSGPGEEEASARAAVLEARQGHAVALAGSGDAGVHALASHIAGLAGDDVDVVGVPGVTAAAAAAALLGAPLGNGAAAISLTGPHTPWEAAERRVRAAAEADSVVTFCQPRRPAADWQLPAALAILGEHRPPDTPAVIVRDAGRPCQRAQFSTIAALDPHAVDPQDIVIVGSSSTRIVAGRLVTPGG
jgi:cobalt-precorrin 5A hydrolase / precorrin-3B C17-methyltransferase